MKASPVEHELGTAQPELVSFLDNDFSHRQVTVGPTIDNKPHSGPDTLSLTIHNTNHTAQFIPNINVV